MSAPEVSDDVPDFEKPRGGRVVPVLSARYVAANAPEALVDGDWR